jgi:hypothetical protein
MSLHAGCGSSVIVHWTDEHGDGTIRGMRAHALGDQSEAAQHLFYPRIDLPRIELRQERSHGCRRTASVRPALQSLDYGNEP